VKLGFDALYGKDLSMNRRHFMKLGAAAATSIGSPAHSAPPAAWMIENEHFSLSLDPSTGALSSVLVKRNRSELIGEKRLLANFRLCLPLPDYQCNYIEGLDQKPVAVDRTGAGFTVRFSGMKSEKGEYSIDLSYTIALENDEVRFRAQLTNKSEYPISEFWFPRIGGWTEFGSRDALLAVPGYTSCAHNISLFKKFPGARGLGAEAAEFSADYPGMPMPWWEMYDASHDTGLHLAYHDKTCRYSTFHTYLIPDTSGGTDAWLTNDQAAGDPVGLVFSHVRYPFIGPGEVFDTGEFVIGVHQGDWHQGSLSYRRWFLENFPFDKSRSWLRRQSMWFSSIIYQPEDKMIADYKTYDRWARDAEECGINCHELIGWNKGGLERDYPEYYPEPRLGGWEGYKALQKSIKSRGARCLTFVNYNILDSVGEEFPELKQYARQDQFGSYPRWFGWGESTLIARKSLSVRRHVLASVVPGFQNLLESRFLKLVEAGADGFQIDKTVGGAALDWNPLNTRKPDEALCEGLVQAIHSLLEKCRTINPSFCIASESGLDRMIPDIDVYYRATSGYTISPLRYVFPEWTAVQHVSRPRDFRAINGAVLTGAVICVEPSSYQGTIADPHYRDLARYLREIERIRQELASIIFLGRFYDDQGAELTSLEVQGDKALSSEVRYAVHGDSAGVRRAIVVANNSDAPRTYGWKFSHRYVNAAKLYVPFKPMQDVSSGSALEIEGSGLHILVEASG
jgi:hypothetical protein